MLAGTTWAASDAPSVGARVVPPYDKTQRKPGKAESGYALALRRPRALQPARANANPGDRAQCDPT